MYLQLTSSNDQINIIDKELNAKNRYAEYKIWTIQKYNINNKAGWVLGQIV